MTEESAALPAESEKRSRLHSSFPALHHRNYQLFFAGQLISVTGSWMETLAMSWLVLSITSSPIKLSLVNACQFAPVLVFGLFAGLVADRFQRRNVLICTQVGMAVGSGLLAVLIATDRIDLWHIYIIALAMGVVISFDMPARQAFVIDMVGPKDLPNAIALNSSVFNMGRLVGPAIGGIILAAFGTAICFGINALSFGAVIISLLMMRLPPKVSRASGRGLADIQEGLAYIKNTSIIKRTMIMMALIATFALNFGFWIPLLAKNSFETGPGGLGLMLSALGIGSLCGALFLAMRSGSANPKTMLFAGTAIGITELAVALFAEASTPFWLVMPLLPILGFGMTSCMASANTIVQTNAPREMNGRIMSVYATIFAGTVPIGAIIAGAISTVLNVPISMAVGGIVALAVVAALWWTSDSNPRNAPAAMGV